MKMSIHWAYSDVQVSAGAQLRRPWFAKIDPSLLCRNFYFPCEAYQEKDEEEVPALIAMHTTSFWSKKKEVTVWAYTCLT